MSGVEAERDRGEGAPGKPERVGRPEARAGLEGGWAAVLFDLDGTLADSVPLILRCYRHTMRAHLGAERPDEAWLRTIGTPLRDQLMDFARDPEEAADMLETYVRFQRTIHDDMVRPFDGARDVLERLAAEGARLGVVTSKRREMALRTLDACGVGDLMETLVAADDVTRGKPDPEPVEQALSHLQVGDRRSRVLFVGDSPFDLRSGSGAGVLTAGALWGPFSRAVLERERPDWLVERLEEVPDLRPVG